MHGAHTRIRYEMQWIKSIEDQKFNFITSVTEDVYGFLVGCSQKGLAVNLNYPLTNLKGNLSQATQVISLFNLIYLNYVVF